MLKKYVALMKAGVRIALSYRFDFVVGIVTVPLALIMYYYLWGSIYAASGATVIKGFTFDELIQYYVLSMIVGFITWSDVDKWVEKDLRKGQLSKMLVRPMAFVGQWLAFEAGLNTMNIALQIIPIFIIGIGFFGLKVVTWLSVAAFAVSLLFSFFIVFGLTYLTGLAAFWLKRITGIRRVRRVLVGFLSGSFIPLSFFPPAVQQASHYLPFEYIRFVPINIYLQKYDAQGVVVQLGLQLLWIAALYGLIIIVNRRALRKYAMGA